MRILLLAIISIILSILILNFITAPFLWMAILWFVVFLVATIVEKRQNIKLVWFNIGFLILAIGCIEGYLWLTSSDSNLSDIDGYIIPDDILGYAPARSNSVSVTKYYGKNLVYDVTYSIDVNGLRISPSTEENNKNGCVLFFGGSFTFGEGVNDDEAMPYLVGKESKYAVYNFGFHGYGPHQMLSALEQGIVKRAINCRPKFAGSSTVNRDLGRAGAKFEKIGSSSILGGCDTNPRSISDEPTRSILPQS